MNHRSDIRAPTVSFSFDGGVKLNGKRYVNVYKPFKIVWNGKKIDLKQISGEINPEACQTQPEVDQYLLNGIPMKDMIIVSHAGVNLSSMPHLMSHHVTIDGWWDMPCDPHRLTHWDKPWDNWWNVVGTHGK
jgi:hypothetical protein